MSTPIIILILIAVGYLLGSMNSALVVSKLLMGYDIRTKGSGNAGLTNSLRVNNLIGVIRPILWFLLCLLNISSKGNRKNHHNKSF